MRFYFVFLVLFLTGCRQSIEKSVEVSPNDIIVKISVEDTSIVFQKDFDVFVSIENKSGHAIEIDTSPNEVIEPRTETFGGSYKDKGSFFHTSVTQDQDNDGQYDFFSSRLIKIPSQNNSINSFSISKGKVHKLKFTLSPWGPVYGALPSYASIGPLDIEALLTLIVNEKTLDIKAEPLKVNFIENQTEKNEQAFPGNYTSQPKLEVTTSSGHVDIEEIEPVIQAAKNYFNSLPFDQNDYWPEPVNVSERDNLWWVKFKYKDKITIVNGIESIQSRAPGVLCIDVDKGTLSCSVHPNR